jgi:hypothetical protein
MVIRAVDFRFLQDGNAREFSCKVEGGPFPERLYFRCQARILPELKAPSGNFALVGLLFPAMALGEDLEIDAPVSPTLLYAIQHDIQSLLLDYRPELKRIKVSATSLTPSSFSTQKDVATGFSAGVDSFSTLALYSGQDVPESRRITSLTTFDDGAISPPELPSEIFEKYTHRVRDYAETNDLKWQVARSNLDPFYTALGYNFQITHVIRNVTSAFIFEDMLSCYLYSSTYPYRAINSRRDDMAFIEPILLPLLSTETLRFESSGAGLARYEKVELVSTYPPAKQLLDVCVAPPAVRLNSKKINCSKCWKCSRMMLNLDILGRLDEFSDVLDIEYYRQNKKDAVMTVLHSADLGKPADRDLMALMQERNFDLGVSKARLLRRKILMPIRGFLRALSFRPRTGA